MVDELRKLGMTVEVESSKVVLRNRYVAAQEGKALTPEQARVLVKLDRKLIYFQMNLLCYWKEGSFSEL